MILLVNLVPDAPGPIMLFYNDVSNCDYDNSVINHTAVVKAAVERG